MKNLIIGIALCALVHIFVWFSMNLQLLGGKWVDRGLVIAMILSVPTSYVGFYATKHLCEYADGSAWSARFVGFGVSYLVFPILTWVILGESMFTAKVMICILLSFIIMAIQIFY